MEPGSFNLNRSIMGGINQCRVVKPTVTNLLVPTFNLVQSSQTYLYKLLLVQNYIS